jgi:hypothetical protein
LISFVDAEPMSVGCECGSGENGIRLAGSKKTRMRWNSLPVFEYWFESQTYGVRPWNSPRPPRTCWRLGDRGLRS